MHISGVVHGDLTGANILITDNGSACLCDFGLSSIAAEFQGTSYITSTLGGNVRWAAPELYHGIEEGSVSTVNTHSDVYSYGSVTLEVRIPVNPPRDNKLIYLSGPFRACAFLIPPSRCASRHGSVQRCKTAATCNALCHKSIVGLH